MSDEKYPLLGTAADEEAMYFSLDVQEQACIGHLRGDFGQGDHFWTTWWDHQEDLKDQAFKDELDDVVNTLRKDGPLKDLDALQCFCWEHPLTQMSPRSGSDYYGCRVDTALHRYYLRLCPVQGNYNFYLYCYKAALLPKTLTVLVVEPMKPCEVRQIPDTLNAMREIVGGRIESFSYQREAIISNEEGKLLRLLPNRPLYDSCGKLIDRLRGTFFIAGISGEHLTSLTLKQIQQYVDLYDNTLIITLPKEQGFRGDRATKWPTAKNKPRRER